MPIGRSRLRSSYNPWMNPIRDAIETEWTEHTKIVKGPTTKITEEVVKPRAKWCDAEKKIWLSQCEGTKHHL